jgi:hypothetical protein
MQPSLICVIWLACIAPHVALHGRVCFVSSSKRYAQELPQAELSAQRQAMPRWLSIPSK